MSSNIKQFNLEYPVRHFQILHVTFWDNYQKIGQIHHLIYAILMDQNSQLNKNKNTEEEGPSDETIAKILLITESLKALIEKETRFSYLLYLKYNFYLAQPLTLYQLKNNFKNKIFPYYLFSIITRKKELFILTINFVEKRLKLINKDKLIDLIKKDQIISITKSKNNSIIISKKDKKEIEIIPEILQQFELIFSIINFFYKNNNSENFSLLEDDTYIPKGIILRTDILKEHQMKLLAKDKRFAVLGPTQIIIFKDQSMREIRNVIPLLPFSVQLFFDDKEITIDFKYFSREQSITFYEIDEYMNWKKKLIDIFDKNIVEKIDKYTLAKINSKKVGDKAFTIFDYEINNITSEIDGINEKLEKAKKIIVNEENEEKKE